MPLGLDRYYRRYWWGLGGVRGVVYVEAEDGCWARLSSLEELGGLVESLDERGVREAELLDSIDKQHGIIAKAMKVGRDALGGRRPRPPLCLLVPLPSLSASLFSLVSPLPQRGRVRWLSMHPSISLSLPLTSLRLAFVLPVPFPRGGGPWTASEWLRRPTR